ncbi:MAG TPA: ketol-acid reductoisomerase [Armatimonadota bacterium]|jgi:ketol-acid reductoisomerase
MIKVYYDDDADLNLLEGSKIAIIGYGAQGRCQALNLRDSGVEVIVSELPGTVNYEQAVADGFQPVTAVEAAKEALLIQMLVQDHVQPYVYKAIAEYLTEGKGLIFSHGFNIHYSQIVPPKNIDVFMVAPKSPGTLVRSEYEAGRGVPCLIAVYQDYTKKAKDLSLAYAKGIGGTRAGVIETTFAEETETDLFGEQAVLCGGVSELVLAGFETLVEAGYQPEMAYFECLHELKLIVDIIYSKGISMMDYVVSDTAEYGDYIAGPRVINEESRDEMRALLLEIQDGTFARNWILENQAGRPHFLAMRKMRSEHPIEEVGKRLRAMMPWMREEK